MSNLPISKFTAAVTPFTGEELLEVSQLSATVTRTATTISALASDNSYNDSATGFISAGFAVGDRVRVKGFSTSGGVNNILSAQITALTTGKMTIGGTDGNVIVDESAGASITITKWTTKRCTAKDVGAAANVAFVDSQLLSIDPSYGSITLDLSSNSTFNLNLTDNVSVVTITGAQTGKVNFFTMRVHQADTGGPYSITPPASWKFVGGSIYVPSTDPGAVDLVQGISFDNGATWLITYGKDFS